MGCAFAHDFDACLIRHAPNKSPLRFSGRA